MVFVNDGIAELNAVGIRNEVGETPSYLSFSGSNNTYIGSESSLSNVFIRKAVSWSQTGINSKFQVQLSSVEAVGSNIESLGLVGGSGIGSNTLFTINQSFIGEKTNTFNVQVEGEIFIRRPILK